MTWGDKRRYGDCACNTVEEKSSFFSMSNPYTGCRHQGHVGTQNSVVHNWGCWLTEVVLYNVHKMVLGSSSLNVMISEF